MTWNDFFTLLLVVCNIIQIAQNSKKVLKQFFTELFKYFYRIIFQSTNLCLAKHKTNERLKFCGRSAPLKF